MDAVKRVHKDLAVVKEDRGPHNIVAMCKKTYFGARHQYMEAQGTFEDAQETTDQVLQRHEQWHLERGLPSHNRLCYIYGIRKSAKRSLRWISGVRKTVAEKEEARAAKETGKSQGPTEKPKGSVAGAGDELVGVLSTVMHTLQAKDAVRRRRGHAKRCWFVESVEEVAQPLRFAARKVATQRSTARTVDFTTMYPCFDQKLLLERVKKAIAEAWTWEEQEGRDGGVQERAPTETVRLTNDGWKWFDAEATAADLLGAWTLDQVMELVEFVVTNGYISRGGKLRRQVRGFGMGLPCAPQLANLACYTVEAEFSEKCQPEDVEMNFRFIDDILTLTGIIPTEKEYGMQYKTTWPTTVREQDTGQDHDTEWTREQMVFLGMELEWATKGEDTRFSTGLHFRDMHYPVRIQRYPDANSMVTDGQRLGVLTGQFIRAQRLCSTMRQFKAGVQKIAWAALQRGYGTREMDRVWGKFLVRWWTARELRRGELRAWFRRMLRNTKRTGGGGREKPQKRRCWYGRTCLHKAACPFRHPDDPGDHAEEEGGNHATETSGFQRPAHTKQGHAQKPGAPAGRHGESQRVEDTGDERVASQLRRMPPATGCGAGRRAGEAKPRPKGRSVEGNTKRGAPCAFTRERGSGSPPEQVPTQEHLGRGQGPLDHMRTGKETEMGPSGDPSIDPETASLSMESTIDDLLACRGFGEAVEEWDLRSQQSDGPPANKDGAYDTKEQDDQKDQGSEPAGQQRPQEQLPARHQHHQQAQEPQHEIVQDNKKHTKSALQDSDRGHTASAETGQGSKETPFAGTVTRAWLRRAQLQVDQQGKQNPHSEQPRRGPRTNKEFPNTCTRGGRRWEWWLEPWWPR